MLGGTSQSKMRPAIAYARVPLAVDGVGGWRNELLGVGFDETPRLPVSPPAYPLSDDIPGVGSGRGAATGADRQRPAVRGVRNFDPGALASYRRRRGLSLDQLGQRIGRARPNVITWEKGRSAPSPPKLVALAEALGVKPWQLTTIDPASAELSDLRAWAGLTQQQLADRAGVVRSTYALVERAELPLRPELAEAVAGLLGRRVREVELAYGRTARQRAAKVAQE